MKTKVKTHPIQVFIKNKDHMRYDTLGDYYYKDDGTLVFEIADTGNALYNKLILIHELTEELCTNANGITEQEILDFDLMFDKECRLEGIHSEEDEPGDDPRCPYAKEHKFSENIERLICQFLSINFDTYNNFIINHFNNTFIKNHK